ncbi:hypothetical protein [Aestuariibaculum lutulentum]|uniref:NACHT domain-containing protein n=1 Tax=Aestuariibaculum lutulentum TaxID=2920935 RepID=A0ABS9RGB9_9FLAO|nr:hypothetical protein [Aestuariibaculum lutulentum]MCH4551986.1 hypothetical protein [Aestuariibaculum lutulentum]
MSKGGYIGYTYQNHVTELFLSKMDTEREIDVIQIEAKTDDKFDDLVINNNKGKYQIQIKDISGVKLEKLNIIENEIFIDNKPHKLSSNTNIIFFNQIDIVPNCEILGFAAFKMSDLYLISLNRVEIDEILTNFYELNPFRKSVIQKFLSNHLDSRKWIIQKNELPAIDIFNTKLIDTINVERELVEFENILHIEGKPGIGKSHLVEFLQGKFPNNLLYRFWLHEQDYDKEDRLKFQKFLFDLSKKLFHDIRHRDENEIFNQIKRNNHTLIFDGLDHVKNYNPSEFNQFVTFINRLKEVCKVIVLSRPFENELDWKKQQLTSWNRHQTEKVLEELFHITDYDIKSKIFKTTGGYPIIVKYLAEQYRSTKTLPELDELTSLDSYYEQILTDTKVKSSLSLFLCSRSYFMKSEISMFLGYELAELVYEFIDEHPYLFEIRLNRISLFHDSLTTYLRKQNINFSQRQNKVNELVFKSIISFEKRFLSRFNSFRLSLEHKYEVLSKFTVIQSFKKLMLDVVDFEAIQSFYTQLREELEHFEAGDFKIIQFYDLSLIINLISKDHVSTINTFQYTYLKALLFNNYTEEDITSSKYLFAMLYYIETNNATLLFNATSNDYYDTEHFIEQLEDDIAKEERYFTLHQNQFEKQKISELLENKYDLMEIIPIIITNLFVHNSKIKQYSKLRNSIKAYLNDENSSYEILRGFLVENDINEHFTSYILKAAKQNILGLGKESSINDYINLSLKDFILKNKHLGSFDLRDEIHNYIRLSVYQQRQVDFSSISMFWTKYYNRKDYSFLTIGTALKTFENKNFIEVENSCKLIKSIQVISEKGHRYLFNDYIKQHSIGIIEFLNNNFDYKDLLVQWLDLPPDYINVLPDFIFQNELKERLFYHRTNKEIEFKELENIFKSNRLEELKYVLNLWKYKVRIPNNDTLKDWLLSEKIEIKEYSEEENKYKKNSQEHFNQGILTIEDKDFILKNKLESYEVAGFADGWYSVFTDLEIYELFERDSVVDNIQKILYNGILGKVRSINSYCSLYYLPGNIPKLIDNFNVDIEFSQLFESFKHYIDMSLFNLKFYDD